MELSQGVSFFVYRTTTDWFFCISRNGKLFKALQDKKLVFLCLQNEQTRGNEAALQGVKEFKEDSRFGNAAEIIMINPSDIQEQKFLNQLAVDTHSNEATTVFIAPPADTIGQYKGATYKERLISDLQNAVSGCCGPVDVGQVVAVLVENANKEKIK